MEFLVVYQWAEFDTIGTIICNLDELALMVHSPDKYTILYAERIVE